MSSPIRIAGLFAGIGGIELGFHRALGEGVTTDLLCESWAPAQRVLEQRFPGVELRPDVRDLGRLPAAIDLLAAGFPCTDLSQAGRTAGITGQASGLVKHVFETLGVVARARQLPWLMIENVPNMLALDRGGAMAYLVSEIESLGYRWAYRVVDSRFTGTPQRRRRVILLASAVEDPRAVLFADDVGAPPDSGLSDDAYGFYWTEGRTGLGWARDAVPTLKGGSSIGIPSPPAIWVPDSPIGRQIVKPLIEDAEELQSFPRRWTDVGSEDRASRSSRWKLVGNAVTADVAAWVASRLLDPGDHLAEEELWDGSSTWPSAAWGEQGKIWRVHISEFPRRDPYRHLLDTVDKDSTEPLSLRASTGFLSRLESGNLGRHPGFRQAVSDHVQYMRHEFAG